MESPHQGPSSRAQAPGSAAGSPSRRGVNLLPALPLWPAGSGTWRGRGRGPFLPSAGARRATLLTHAGTGSWGVRLCLHMSGFVLL